MHYENFVFDPSFQQKMVDNCESCKKWREHYFWDHAKCIHFFKTMNGDFSKQMVKHSSFLVKNQFNKSYCFHLDFSC